jgi:acetyl esterase/lipase
MQSSSDILPRPHGLPEAPEDKICRVLHRLVPLKAQHYVRDSGTLRSLMDNGAYLAAFAICVSQPSAIARFGALGRQLTVFRYGALQEEELHVYKLREAHLQSTKPKSVLIYVHGGAWGSGKPWHYRLMAEGLAKCTNACTAIVVRYPVFPDSTIRRQSESILEALKYVHRNRELMGVPRGAKYVLSAHSSGANISALALIKGIHERVKLVDYFVGLAGVFDIERHYQFEATRGLHEVSPMGAAAISRERFAESSPTLIVPDLPAEDLKACWPWNLLLHGQLDTTVPYTSSMYFAKQLQEKGVPVETCYPQEVLEMSCLCFWIVINCDIAFIDTFSVSPNRFQ